MGRPKKTHLEHDNMEGSGAQSGILWSVRAPETATAAGIIR